MKVKGAARPRGGMRRATVGAAPSTDLDNLDRFECEHTCWDPKESELCLHRVRPDESLVEARSDTDVQIVRLIWV